MTVASLSIIHTIDEEEQQEQTPTNADHDDGALNAINLKNDNNRCHHNDARQHEVPITVVLDDVDDDEMIPTADAIELIMDDGMGGGALLADAATLDATTATEVTTTITMGAPSLPLTMIASEASTRRMNLVEAVGEAIGKPLYPLSSTDESSSESSCDNSNDENETCNNAINARRAEFVSTTIIKKPPGTKMGLRLSENEEDNRTTRIAEIEAGGMLSTSPLRKGDVLLSVNGKRCTGLETAKVTAMLTEAAGTVTLVARNLVGNARRVESMFQKANPESIVGMKLARRLGGGGGSLRISQLNDNGIAVHSLLNPGDRVLSINGVGCNGLSVLQAKELIQRSTRDVTVLCEVPPSWGVVVSAASARSIRASVTSTTALRASALLAGEQRATATALDNVPEQQQQSTGVGGAAGKSRFRTFLGYLHCLEYMMPPPPRRLGRQQR